MPKQRVFYFLHQDEGSGSVGLSAHSEEECREIRITPKLGERFQTDKGEPWRVIIDMLDDECFEGFEDFMTFDSAFMDDNVIDFIANILYRTNDAHQAFYKKTP